MSTTTNTGTETVDSQVSTEPNGGSTTQEEKTSTEERSFTQAELNEIVEKRLAKERGKFSDYESLKEAAQKLQEIEEANATDMEKAIAQAVREKEKEVTALFTERLVKSAITSAATGKFQDVQDAHLRLAGQADDFVVNGEIDTEAISTAVDSILEASPHLKAVQAEAPTPTTSAAQVGIGVHGSPTPPSKGDALRDFLSSQVN